MNNFCRAFEHNYKLPSIDDLFPKGKSSFKIVKSIPNSLLDERFFEWLAEHNIYSDFIAVAWKPKLLPGIYNNVYGSIHTDSDISKINFVIGGTDSEMIWFEDPEIISSSVTNINTTFLKANDKQVLKELHREKIKSALVNAGPYHFVENIHDDRFCIQCELKDMLTKKNMSFADANKRLFG